MLVYISLKELFLGNQGSNVPRSAVGNIQEWELELSLNTQIVKRLGLYKVAKTTRSNLHDCKEYLDMVGAGRMISYDFHCRLHSRHLQRSLQNKQKKRQRPERLERLLQDS